MSAFKSFTDTLSSNDAREATIHAIKYCEGGKLQISSNIIVDYKKRWYPIVEEFLTLLRNYPIVITSMITDYGQVDITFRKLKRTKQIPIWEAIEMVRKESRNLCMECGEDAKPYVTHKKVVVLCRACKSSAEKTGDTGTWLDKY